MSCPIVGLVDESGKLVVVCMKNVKTTLCNEACKPIGAKNMVQTVGSNQG